MPFARSHHFLLAALLILSVSNGAAQAPGPRIAGCPVFPADNVWNVPIDNLPLLPRSQDYIASIGPAKGLHPDFGANGGMPITVIDSAVKPVKVTFQYAADSDPGSYPIPPDALLEGGQNAPADSDRHVLIVEKDNCMLFELWAASRQSDTAWKAGSGIKMDLNSNALREDGKTSADAAGLPVLPGLVRYDEVASGEIRHALRFTVPRTQADHVWPARHDASNLDDPKFPPLGVRFRLRADFDISGFSKTNQVILTALKHYGMFLADNGAAWFLSGSPDPRWNDDDLHLLLNVKGSDFEAVDESRLRASPNSARVKPAAQK
jgi:hypothetical protein